MNDTTELITSEQLEQIPSARIAPTPPLVTTPDAKALRTEAVGALLSGAYQGASTLKLKPDEVKRLTADFPDEAIEIRPFDGLIYVPHMQLRERLWDVFGPTEVAEICRERFMRPDSNEIAVDLVLMIRGKFVAEGVGTAKYYPSNAKGSFGDTVESAWSEALRRCAKKIGVGTAVWRPDYVRRWVADNAVEKNGKWFRKDDPKHRKAGERTFKEYTLKDDKPVTEFSKMKAAVQATGEPEVDESTGIPF